MAVVDVIVKKTVLVVVAARALKPLYARRAGISLSPKLRLSAISVSRLGKPTMSLFLDSELRPLLSLDF